MEREEFVDGVPGTELLVDIKKDNKNVIEATEIVYIPPPTKCGADPLGWPRYKKYWQLFVVSLYACCFAYGENNLGAAWTTVSEDIGVNMNNMNGGSALNWLLLGFFNVLWIPTAMKIGRKPVFIGTTVIALCAMVWVGKCNGNAQWFLAMTLNGLGVAGYEAMIQLTIFDTFFVHERGRALAVYLFSQQLGSVIGLVSGGAQADTIGWRWSQFIVAIADAVVFALFVFTFQETLFPRFLFERGEHTKFLEQFKSSEVEYLDDSPQNSTHKLDKKENVKVDLTDEVFEYEIPKIEDFPAPSWGEIITKWWVYYPQDKTTFWQYFRRPFILFTFPNILYAGFNFGFGGTAGMLSFSTIAEILMDDPYNYSTSTTGLMCLGSLVGSGLGGLAGSLSDYVVIFFAKRNNGVKEPEMRLFAMIFPFCFGAIGYMMYGWGAEQGDAWPVISVGIGFMTAQQVSSCSIATSYAMDCFRGISGELVVVLAIFSACINFAVSYSCQEFLTAAGYGWLMFFWAMLVLSANASAILLMFKGKSWRRGSADRYFKFVEEGKQ
ncbi:hypothetical protein PMKS-001578 [Pichia membranifaciens]|uniref:Major facilitator superfamily (MFS) profile domain-containing protein n=1 Tax=Pichia membranifaciens TaxID=4926 RepID=A0A1Q2YEX1_9ASCO|nr:hypothetical protein PMKS-001578 [Pichia membranifaciens]